MAHLIRQVLLVVQLTSSQHSPSLCLSLAPATASLASFATGVSGWMSGGKSSGQGRAENTECTHTHSKRTNRKYLSNCYRSTNQPIQAFLSTPLSSPFPSFPLPPPSPLSPSNGKRLNRWWAPNGMNMWWTLNGAYSLHTKTKCSEYTQNFRTENENKLL